MTERYLLGELSGTERELFEEHFFNCAACASEIKAAEVLLRNLSPAHASAAVRNPQPSRWAWLSGWMRPVQWAPVAASLAVSGWLGVSNHQLRNAPMAWMTTPALDAPSRGAEGLTLVVPREAPFFTVSLDDPDPAESAVIDVAAADGRVIERATVSIRERKTHSLVLASAKYPDGRYTIRRGGAGVLAQFELKRNDPTQTANHANDH